MYPGHGKAHKNSEPCHLGEIYRDPLVWGISIYLSQGERQVAFSSSSQWERGTIPSGPVWACCSNPFTEKPETLPVLNEVQNKRSLCHMSRILYQLFWHLVHLSRRPNGDSSVWQIGSLVSLHACIIEQNFGILEQRYAVLCKQPFFWETTLSLVWALRNWTFEALRRPKNL